MRRLTRSELAGLREDELRGLLREAFNALASTTPETSAHRDAAASIECIQGELKIVCLGRKPK